MKKSEYSHAPVFLNEVLQGLNIRADGFYVDCTYGRGGHSRAILRLLNDDGRLLAIDKDPEAIAAVDAQLKNDSRFVLVHGSYTMLDKIIKDYKKIHQVNGILLDLGVSSPQLDDPQRGFSFSRDGRLDMRMDNSSGMTAAEWLNTAAEHEIEEVLRQYGEERYAKRIARAITGGRRNVAVTRTVQLAEMVAAAVPSRGKKIHPATRTFQAIRIFLNQELENLQKALGQTVEILAVGGRLAVISFHSLEDRQVKRFMRKMSRGDNYPPDVPVTGNMLRPRMMIGKAVHPSSREIDSNPRARSAVLRIAEKLCI
ncbi:MAG: 16S rRNA (cytosine(1402)-N(4))-methyltransferase RsmH [Gammaproteobacteria bacterium]